jgi:hypothetical protein
MRTLFYLSILFFFSCSSPLKIPYGQQEVPPDPDYSDLNYWASHPKKEDPADKVPNGYFENRQDSAAVDIFFLHPTSYLKKSKFGWNGPVNDAALNQSTDGSSILFQASIFNGIGKIYAPRYRQAHISAYFSLDKESAIDAFHLAYSDVEKAFLHYLENENNGRPFIIASHSQGTTHAKTLIRKHLDGKPISEKLIAVYLVGIPVEKNYFQFLPICEEPEQTGCFCTWRTYKSGHYPKRPEDGELIAVTNPISWNLMPEYVPKEMHKGAVLRDFKTLYTGIADAMIQDGLLWVNKPKFRGSFLITRKNYHIADYNFFYLDVRENASLRTTNYLLNNN